MLSEFPIQSPFDFGLPRRISKRKNNFDAKARTAMKGFDSGRSHADFLCFTPVSHAFAINNPEFSPNRFIVEGFCFGPGEKHHDKIEERKCQRY